MTNPIPFGLRRAAIDVDPAERPRLCVIAPEDVGVFRVGDLVRQIDLQVVDGNPCISGLSPEELNAPIHARHGQFVGVITALVDSDADDLASDQAKPATVVPVGTAEHDAAGTEPGAADAPPTPTLAAAAAATTSLETADDTVLETDHPTPLDASEQEGESPPEPPPVPVIEIVPSERVGPFAVWAIETGTRSFEVQDDGASPNLLTDLAFGQRAGLARAPGDPDTGPMVLAGGSIGDGQAHNPYWGPGGALTYARPGALTIVGAVDGRASGPYTRWIVRLNVDRQP